MHDATLESLTFSWEEGLVLLRLSTGVNGTGVVILEATDVKGIVCPRLFPWGPSDSVNEAKVQSRTAGVYLTIEMQSGDLLEITCKEVLEKSSE
jgi:hypothetical protein